MSAPDEPAGIYARYSPYLERHVQLGLAGGKVISVSFPDEPDDGAGEDHELLDRLFRYFDGVSEDDFGDVEVGLTVPTADRAVLEAVRKIPYGEMRTCEDIARMVPDHDPTDDDDLIAVREALAANPVPIFVPDHRVRDGASPLPPVVEQKLKSLEST